MSEEQRLSDLEILRRYEPVLCFTRGEPFFPTDIDRYIRQSSLWVQRPDEPPEMLVQQGDLTLEKLSQPRQDGFGSVYFLKFIEPLDLLELARYSLKNTVQSLSRRDPENVFHAGRGRLARVGYTSRFVAALFSLTLLLRGRVPGDTAIAAAIDYAQLQQLEERYCYYGRVRRENGWIILQYWFFYTFNNWRSGFHGVNDHEADWEMITLYCAEGNASDCEDGACITPEWAAYSSHYFSGDDLRRRWDDPEMQKYVDEQGFPHPLVFVGAGSHASYFSPGEYLIELNLTFLSPLVQLVRRLQYFWVNVLRQTGARMKNDRLATLNIPFVDYARGDGKRIGPGQTHTWEAHQVSEDDAWASEYRGLWGLYVQDPIAGENAPGGPIYSSDSGVRQSWFNPLGWAGLDKVAPSAQTLKILDNRTRESQERCRNIRVQIQQKGDELVGLGVESAALAGYPDLERLYRANTTSIQDLSEDLNELRRQLTQEEAKLDAFAHQAERLKQSDFGSPRAHLRHPLQPASEANLRLGKVAEIFAAMSIGLTMIGIVAIGVFAQHFLIFGISILLSVLIFVEAGFRRRLESLVTSLVIGLAILSSLILIYEFFWQIAVGVVLVAGLYVMWENLREIRS
jgi:hypothetical protein